MKIIELDRTLCREQYNGDYQKMIDEEDGIIMDDSFVKRAFNFGHGTIEDLKTYMKLNRVYCRYYDMLNHEFI